MEHGTGLEKRKQLIEILARIGFMGAGVGAAGRSLLGLRQLTDPRPLALGPRALLPDPIPLKVFRSAEEEEEDTAPRLPMRRPKAAAVDMSQLWDDAKTWAAEKLPETGIAGASHPVLSSLGIPLAAGTALGTTYGGWKLLDWLLRKQRKGVMTQALRKAEEDYEKAVADQYRNAMRSKAASTADTRDVSAALDELHADLHDMAKQAGVKEIYEKMKAAPQMAWDVGHGASGAYLAALALLAAAAFHKTHQWTRGRSPSAVVSKALKQRYRQYPAPGPAYASPVRVPLLPDRPPKSTDVEDVEEA